MTALDSDVAALLSEMREAGMPSSAALSVEGARGLIEEYDDVFGGGETPEVDDVRDLEIAGPNGGIPVRIYRPETDETPPVLSYYHGGGWVLGDIEARDGFCRRLARDAACIVSSVDYRRAPEHPFPEPLEDAYAAAAWASEHAATLGGDPDRVAVGGDSAGGNLAAATALLARDRGEFDPAHQLLIYPVVDDSVDRDSYEENAEGYFLTREKMAWYFERYLANEIDRANPYAFPLKARDLGGLPPATVVTCGFDPLRDEGQEYAGRLADAGVPVTRLGFEDLIHGFLIFPHRVERAAEAVDEVIAAVGGAL